MTSNISTIKAFADHLPAALIILDQQFSVIWWNEAAAHLLLITEDERLQSITNLIPTEEFKHYIESKTLREKHIEFHLSNNKTLNLIVTLIPYQALGFLLHVDDVTHLQRLEKMRQDFVANVSHELRTPLTVIRGYIETFLDHPNIDEISREKILNQILDQSIRMERIVEDLLLLSRLETNNLQAADQETIDVGFLLQSIKEDALALSNQRQHTISLEIKTNKFIYGNKSELRSAFSNLIYNAIHYSPDESAITVRWFQDQHGLHLSVQDNGIGFESKHIPRITERFYRVDDGRSRSRGGTGLGLAIVKHVLIRHNASLHIESTVSKGSIFRCDFQDYSISKN